MSIPTRAPIIQSPVGHLCVCCGKEHGGCCGQCPRAVEYPELFGEKLPDKMLGIIAELQANAAFEAVRTERLMRRAYAENPAHCDALILHAPGECEFCDRRPDLQRLRVEHGINFTGHREKGKRPCPADELRSTSRQERWGGNRPSPPGEKPIGRDWAGYAVHQSWLDRQPGWIRRALRKLRGR